jgi:hypothetical protein
VKESPARWVLPLGCALAGGVLGYFAFLWIARQGLYAIALPGVLIGLAGGGLVKQRSSLFASVCAALALIAGIVSEWRFSPFVADNSFGYFVTHLQQLRPITLIMIALGAVFAAWFALGRSRPAPAPAPSPTRP